MLVRACVPPYTRSIYGSIARLVRATMIHTHSRFVSAREPSIATYIYYSNTYNMYTRYAQYSEYAKRIVNLSSRNLSLCIGMCWFFFGFSSHHFVYNKLYISLCTQLHSAGTRDLKGASIFSVEAEPLLRSGVNCYEMATVMLYYSTIPIK